VSADVSAVAGDLPATRAERAQATRRRLIDVAVELFAERAFNDVQVSEIAQRAGVAHGVLFHHFGSKRGLYVEAVNEISKVLFELPVPAVGAPPAVRIRQLLYEHFLRMAEHEALVVGYINGSLGIASDPAAWEILEERRMEIIANACQIVGFDPQSLAPRLTLRAISAALDQLSALWLQQGRLFPVDSVVEAMMHIVVGALRGASELDSSLDTSVVDHLLAPPQRVPPSN
jgi:AcrR family transcriptional regulator